MSVDSDRKTLLAFWSTLKRLKNSTLVKDADALDVACQTLACAFDFNENEAVLFQNFDLLAAVRDTVKAAPTASSPSFDEYVSVLNSKGFFEGAVPGSPEYESRLASAKSRFAERHGSPAAAIPVAKVVSEDDKKRAEEAKVAGNKLLGEFNYKQAAQKYTEAIGLNPQNHVYYANRAAAYANLEKYSDVISDCQRSIQIEPSYCKAHYRMGCAFLFTGEIEKAVQSLERALELSDRDPNMKPQIEEQLAAARSKANSVSTTAADDEDDIDGDAPFGGSGMPDLSSMLGNMDLGAIMQNPMFQQMAASLSQQMASGNLDMSSLLSGMGMPGMPGAPAPRSNNAAQNDFARRLLAHHCKNSVLSYLHRDGEQS